MPVTHKLTPSKLAENPDVIACAVCLRQPEGPTIIHALHGNQLYGPIFQHVLNIHEWVSDEAAEIILGNLTIRSYRDRNYILMTLMIRSCDFTKSCKRSMTRVLKQLNNVDMAYGHAVIPDPVGHLAAPPTYSGDNPPPPESPVYQNGWTSEFPSNAPSS